MNNDTEKGDSLAHHIWEGSVGIRVRPRRKKDGEYFWTYEFVRCYRNEGEAEFKYTSNFSERNDEAIGKAMARWSQFREENSATSWVERQMANAA